MESTSIKAGAAQTSDLLTNLESLLRGAEQRKAELVEELARTKGSELERRNEYLAEYSKKIEELRERLTEMQEARKAKSSTAQDVAQA